MQCSSALGVQTSKDRVQSRQLALANYKWGTLKATCAADGL